MATEAWIGVWTVESQWIHRRGLVDRRIEYVTLHELLHALMPMGHRDDPLSAVNNINAPDWIELDPSEEALIRLHRNRLIVPGMTMVEVRELIVLEEELLDPPDRRGESLTPFGMLREAYRALQNADSATWRIEGGWGDNCAELSFGRADYTIAGFKSRWPDLSRVFDGQDRVFHFSDDNWSRDGGVWVKDPPDFWDDTHWRSRFSEIHVMFVSAFYFASGLDIHVESAIGGETTLRFTLDNTIRPTSDWYRSATLSGRLTIDDRTLVITAYDLDWHFDTISSRCDGYTISATQGQYGVRFDVPDAVYSGTTDDMREVIDRVNGPR